MTARTPVQEHVHRRELVLGRRTTVMHADVAEAAARLVADAGTAWCRRLAAELDRLLDDEVTS